MTFLLLLFNFCSVSPSYTKSLRQETCRRLLRLSECDKKDTLFFYSFGFRILDTSVTCRFLSFIQPFDFLLLLLNFNFLKFMYH